MQDSDTEDGDLNLWCEDLALESTVSLLSFFSHAGKARIVRTTFSFKLTIFYA